MNVHFKNIKGVEISNCHLKQINQNDLKLLPELEFLALTNNDIKLLEDNLFSYNLNLEVVDFSGNGLFLMGITIFSNLEKLHSLDIRPCLSTYYEKNSFIIKSQIQHINLECIDLEMASIVKRIRSAENEVKSISSTSTALIQNILELNRNNIRSWIQKIKIQDVNTSLDFFDFMKKQISNEIRRLTENQMIHTAVMTNFSNELVNIRSKLTEKMSNSDDRKLIIVIATGSIVFFQTIILVVIYTMIFG